MTAALKTPTEADTAVARTLLRALDRALETLTAKLRISASDKDPPRQIRRPDRAIELPLRQRPRANLSPDSETLSSVLVPDMNDAHAVAEIEHIRNKQAGTCGRRKFASRWHAFQFST
jgi:hypothetical protein